MEANGLNGPYVYRPASARADGTAYSTAFTIDSITFFASPNTIIVFGM